MRWVWIVDKAVEVALGRPRGPAPLEVAGPEQHDLVDMARRTLAARGEGLGLTTGWAEPFGVEMAGDVLLPGPNARIAPTTFDDWLERQTLTV